MTKVTGTEIQWMCMQKSIWRLVDHSIMNISDKDREWIDSILKIPDFISASAGTATAELLCPSVFIFSLFIPELCIISSQNVSYCIKQCYLNARSTYKGGM
jgi:hypothetical protein